MGLSNFSFVFLGAKNPFQCVLPNGTIIDNKCSTECTEYIPSTRYHSYAFDWGIICDQGKLSGIQVAHMSGLFIGAIFVGHMADRLGRLPILYASTVLICIFNLLTIFVPNATIFMVITCLGGIACQGAGLMSYNIILELVGPSYRAFAGIFEQIIYAIGIAILALMAFLLPIWTQLALAIAFFGPPAVLIMLPFHIESIRWQASQPNSREKVLKGLRYVLKVNGHSYEDHAEMIEQWLATEQGAEIPVEDLETEKVALLRSCPRRPVKRDSVWDLLKEPMTLKWLVFLCVAWFVNAACYYGSTIEAGEAFSNPFLGLALSGLIEIPAHCLSPFLMNRFGRRRFHAFMMIFSGIFFLLVWPLSFLDEVVIYVVFTAAKLCCSMAFASAYVYASELFPTSVNSAAIGFCLTIGRFGAVVSPLVLPLGRAPASLIFGVFITLGGLQALLLRETLNQSVPLTMTDLRESKLQRI
ncbi:hypothetical protein Ciccas_010995 [Cichlidogyrus casuarinus]|uniref:Major facilitator superfamily (MFS) profile domain-containing protein n=1 Tax=Cichlidogyrus casuarinus TaxID=1844966 RepID=A0ABD2PSJ0_9PLAT